MSIRLHVSTLALLTFAASASAQELPSQVQPAPTDELPDAPQERPDAVEELPDELRNLSPPTLQVPTMRTEPWVLDDGIGTEQVPWDDFDPAEHFLPRGTVHLGVNLRIAALPGGAPGIPEGPLVEAGLFLDIRYRRELPWRLRIALALNYQPYASENLGAGTTIESSPFAFRLRISPLSFDIGEWVTIRIGGEIGGQSTPQPGTNGSTAFLGGMANELVIRLLDGTLEAGATVGFQTTAAGRTTRAGYGTSLTAEAVIGVTVGYIFL